MNPLCVLCDVMLTLGDLMLKSHEITTNKL